MNMYNINALTYTTHENMEWFTRAMFGGRLVQGGYIRVLTGIKGDELLSMIDLENKILQIDGKDCAWTPNQIIKLSEKTASVKTYKINLEECIDTLETKRTNYMLSPGATNTELPAELEDATLALIAIGLSNEIEEMIIGGNASVNPNEINGLVRTLLLSPDPVKLIGTTAISTSNVLDKIQAVYDAFPEEVLQTEDAGTLLIFGSYATRRKMRNALADKTNQVLFPLYTLDDTDKKNPKIYYSGVEFVPVKGIGNNTLVGIDSTNVLLLTDLLSDLDQVELGQFAKPMDNKVFIKGRLRLGMVVPFEDEAVIMDPSISSASAGTFANDDLRVVPNSLVFLAAGETKTFTAITKDTAATISLSSAPVGYTVSAGTTTSGVTTITVVAAANTGNMNPKVGQVIVKIVGTDRTAGVTLDQHNEDVITITP